MDVGQDIMMECCDCGWIGSQLAFDDNCPNCGMRNIKDIDIEQDWNNGHWDDNTD